MLASANAAGSMEYRNVNHEEQKCFDDARSLEVSNMLDLDAYKLLSPEESIASGMIIPTLSQPLGLLIGGNLRTQVV